MGLNTQPVHQVSSVTQRRCWIPPPHHNTAGYVHMTNAVNQHLRWFLGEFLLVSRNEIKAPGKSVLGTMIWFYFCFMQTHKTVGSSSCRVGTVKWFLKCERACLRSQGWMRCVFLIGTQRSVEDTEGEKIKILLLAPPLMCSFCASPLCRVGGRCSMKCCSMEVLD